MQHFALSTASIALWLPCVHVRTLAHVQRRAKVLAGQDLELGPCVPRACSALASLGLVLGLITAVCCWFIQNVPPNMWAPVNLWQQLC